MVSNNAKSVLILNGSPRENGNTAVLINWLEEALRQQNCAFSRYDLYHLNIKGCSHCNVCKRILNQPGCIIHDDATEILKAITQATVIVMASPIYCWSFSGCMSSLHDRMYCLFKNEIGGKCLFAGKKMLGMFSSAGDAFSGMQYCDAALKEICLYGGANYIGTIAATKCDTPDNLLLRKELQQEIVATLQEHM